MKTFSFLALLLALFGLISCTQNSVTGQPVFNRPVPPPVVAQWRIQPIGEGYSLNVIINGQSQHVRNGGPYTGAHRVDATINGSVSAFRVEYPSGGYQIFELVPTNGRNVVYSRYFNIATGSFDQPKVEKKL